ncbi:MAG TPA: transporter substrate-binding domain-containing protein [Candidatus Acidoferrum sp.]|nr:transporter substrate-binding domain-containing protein [Candidatus Acidoferrum sp.]
MKVKKFAALLLAIVLVFTLAACAKKADAEVPETPETPVAEDDLSYVTANGKLLIGYTVYEPMNYTDAAGNFTGFDTEFANAVCGKLGVTPEFVEINWDTKVIELDAKSIDCIWNGMTITEELKANIAVSEPYVKNMQVVVIRSADATKYTDTASLAGANLVAEAGSAGESVIAGDADLAKATYVAVSKQTDALMEVKAGTSDAAVLDWTLAKSMVGEGTDYAELQMVDGLELSVEEYGIGFRKDSTLCTKVNEIMAELIADGTLPALAEKYGLSLAE